MGNIFISYSHKDKKYVEKLEQKLLDEGFNVWIDHRIDYGSRWTTAIETAIDTCDAYIVVMSEDAKKSEWVQREMIHAEKRKKPFFPLLLNGETWFSLGNIQYVDVSDGSLPPEKYYQRIKRIAYRDTNYDFEHQSTSAPLPNHKSQSERIREFEPPNKSRVQYKKKGIKSKEFSKIYFKGMKTSIIINIILMPLLFFFSRWIPLYLVLVPLVTILWSIGYVIVRSIQKDGLKTASGWGWLSGALTMIVSLVTLVFAIAYIDEEEIITTLLISLGGVILVGILVNLLPEISSYLIRKRTKQVNAYISEWGEDICQAVINQEIEIGMNNEMVLLSWGKPNVIMDQEMTHIYHTERWVYKFSKMLTYVWFTNGSVNKIIDLSK